MKIIKSFSIYASVGFLGAGISFLLLPLLTHYLSPEDYGKLSLFNAYVAVLVPILGLSVTSILGVDFFRLDRSDFSSLFKSVSVIPLLGAVMAIIVIFFFGGLFSSILRIPVMWLYLLVFMCFCIIGSNVFQSLLINKKEPQLYAGVYAGRIFLEITLTIVFVIGAGMNWEGRIASRLLTVLLIAVIALLYFNSSGYFDSKIDRSRIMSGLMFGIPLIPHQLGKFVINQSDRLFLAKMVSISETGIYSVGYLVGSIILILSSAALKVYSPFLFERLGDLDAKKKIEIIRFSYVFVLSLAVVTIIINLLSPFVFEHLLNENFEGGIKYVFWISLSYFFWGVYLVFTGYVYHLKKTHILSKLAILNVVLNLVGNYLMIKEFGAIGAAYSTTFSFFTVMCLMVVISTRVFPMPWLNFRMIFSFRPIN